MKFHRKKNDKGLVNSIKIVCEPSWDIQALKVDKMKKSKCNYIDGGYHDGFKSHSDYKQIEICLGEVDDIGYDLVGWLRIRISFDEYFSLTISDAGKDLLTMEECDLSALVRLRDFLNYAISGNYEIENKKR
jgi:hypothetical protein